MDFTATEVSDVKCSGGFVFRFHRNAFTTPRGFHFNESLNILKRKSCKCIKCMYLMDSM